MRNIDDNFFHKTDYKIKEVSCFADAMRKLTGDEYKRCIDNIDFIFILTLKYKNFIYDQHIYDEYSNSPLVALIKTSDNRKIMEQKIDLWQQEGKLSEDNKLSSEELYHVGKMLPYILKSLNEHCCFERSEIKEGYILSGLIEQLKSHRKNPFRVKVSEIIDDFIRFDKKYNLAEAKISYSTGKKGFMLKNTKTCSTNQQYPITSLEKLSVDALINNHQLST